jgi:hypothetical protein
MSQVGLLPLAYVAKPVIAERPIEELPAFTGTTELRMPLGFAGPVTGVVSREARDRGSVVAERSSAGLHAALAGLPAIFAELAASVVGPSHDQLGRLLTTFAGLPDRAPALESLRERPHLAETLALFGPLGGESELVRERAASLSRCHLCINTDANPPAQVADGEAMTLAKEYAKTLGYQTLLQRDGRLVGVRNNEEIDLMPLDSKAGGALLRRIGQALNEKHFQNAAVVPPDRIPITTDSREYRHENAYWCSQLSMLAYAEEADVRAMASAWGFKDVRFVNDSATSTEAIVLSGERGTFVAFRGTSNFTDFKTDILFRKTDGFGGRVHSGFKKAYDSVSAKIAAAVAEVSNGRPVFFTGHSLGAALAQLSAIDLADRGVSVAGVYTYGSPYVGDRAFAARYNSKLGDITYHHVNNRDAVTGVPPKIFGYAQAGHHLFTYNADGELARTRIEPPRMRALESLAMVESVADPREAIADTREAAVALAAAVRAIEMEMTGGKMMPEMMGARAMALEGVFSPASDHYCKNYLRLACAEVRKALLS